MEWKQEGNKVYFDYEGEEIYFIVPNDFSLEKTSKDLINLMEILLLSPWNKETLEYRFTRKKGNKVGLGMSTGVDSTAAMCLLPKDTVLLYLERDFKSGIIHDNAYKFINNCDRKIIPIKSNHEKIRTHYGLMNGFSVDLACLAHVVLLADYYDLGYVSAGMVLESAYLRNGYEYRDFNNSDYWKKWSKIFSDCGLELVLPVAGLSEVLTTKLVNGSQYKEYAQSCLRDNGGCNNCYKCFRKKLLNGELIDINRETEIAIKKRPPKMASSIIYAIKKYGVEIKELKEFKDIDFSYLDKYYEYSFEIIPKELIPGIKSKLDLAGILKMDEEDVRKLKMLDLSEYG